MEEIRNRIRRLSVRNELKGNQPSPLEDVRLLFKDGINRTEWEAGQIPLTTELQSTARAGIKHPIRVRVRQYRLQPRRLYRPERREPHGSLTCGKNGT